MPDGADTDLDDDTQRLLTSDFEIGHYIRERIVPRAVLYFTGKASLLFNSLIVNIVIMLLVLKNNKFQAKVWKTKAKSLRKRRETTMRRTMMMRTTMTRRTRLTTTERK